MTELETLRAELSASQLALGKLVRGSLRETVMQTAANTSHQVTYTRTSVPALKEHIEYLRFQIGMLDGTGAGQRRPIHFG